MLKQRSDQAFLFFLCLTDLGLTATAWVLAYIMRWPLEIGPTPTDVPPMWWCFRSLPIVLIMALVSYQSSGLYQLRKRLPLWREAIRIGRGTLLMMLLIAAATFYTRDPYESRLASVYFWTLSFAGLIGLRRGLGLYFRFRRQSGVGCGRAVIVGTGRIARRLEKSLRANNWLALEPIGFVEAAGDATNGQSGAIGSIENLSEIVERENVDYVFIALPLHQYAEARKVFRRLANTLVEVRLVPDVPRLAAMGPNLSEIEGLPVMNLRGTPFSFFDAVLKRIMDIILSAAALLILSPVFAVIAILVKLNDKGPVFFKQERMGLNGHRFNMYKFRSMRVDAETQSGPVWASQGDNRRTRLGAFLRETSLDELPQFYNVLVGDMSLVGPRPERPFFISNFRQSIPRYMLRHSVKSGITGWAQVNGWRGNTSLRKRIQYDLYYISHWSILFDIRILFLTFIRVLWDRHAY